MVKYIALWEKETGAPCFHLKPVEADNYQVLLDNAQKNNITITTIFDVTNDNKEPKEVYSHPTNNANRWADPK